MHAERASTDSDHVELVQCAAAGVGPIRRLAEDNGGEVSRVINAEDAPRPMYEFGWNHTTLHALRYGPVPKIELLRESELRRQRHSGRPSDVRCAGCGEDLDG